MTVALQSHPGQARYAASRATYICVLLDVRNQAKPKSLQVWSKRKGKIVNLPRKDRDGFPIIEIISREFNRWAAVDVPRWLIDAESLWDDGSEESAVFERSQMIGPQLCQQIRDDAEWRLEKYEVDYANKYRRLPGQHLGWTRGEYASARAFE